MKMYHMKMRVVIELFFRSHNNGNCVLDHIILYSDECLVLIPDDDSRKVSCSFLTFLAKLQHQANKPEAQMLLFSSWPGWLYQGICAGPPKGWTSACYSSHHSWIWWSWLSLFSSGCMARTDTVDIPFPFSLHSFTSDRAALQPDCILTVPLERTVPAWTNGHILLMVQAANKAFNIDSQGPSKTTVDTLCLRHCW